MSSPTIRRVSHSAILGAANAPKLIAEYAAECSIPDAQPQIRQYEALEQAGALQCFGAYVGEELVGFASVLSAIMPHHGKRIATLESVFVTPEHRNSAAGEFLLAATEEYATEAACVAFLYTARTGSRFEKLLLNRYNCAPSHTVYTRWL